MKILPIEIINIRVSDRYFFLKAFNFIFASKVKAEWFPLFLHFILFSNLNWEEELNNLLFFLIKEADNWTTLSTNVEEIFSSGDVDEVCLSFYCVICIALHSFFFILSYLYTETLSAIKLKKKVKINLHIMLVFLGIVICIIYIYI